MVLISMETGHRKVEFRTCARTSILQKAKTVKITYLQDLRYQTQTVIYLPWDIVKNAIGYLCRQKQAETVRYPLEITIIARRI